MNTLINEIKNDALKNNVPIIQDASLAVINEIIKANKIKKIIEIGTAVGYSSLCFSANETIERIDTFERNPKMYNQAIENINRCSKENVIFVHFGDALNVDISAFSRDYDLLFIDAAKAQSQRFFELYSKLLSAEGIIIVDNILFHGVQENDESISRNLRSLIRKINNFVEWLKSNEEYETIFFNGGDGLAISKKKC